MYTKWVTRLEQRTCPVCDRDFTTYPSQNRLTCGKACKVIAQRKPLHRKCITCDTPFVTNPSRDKRYCSQACALPGFGNAESRECLICGTAFTTFPAQNKRYCSQACRGVARRKPDSESIGRVRLAYVPYGHPLATPGNRQVQQHRLLLWDEIGPGPHPCYHCGDPVDWIPGSYTAQGSLVVDHLDRNPRNNDLSNLKPSCQTCNIKNSARIIQDHEDYFIDSHGNRKRGDRRDCGCCGTSFVAPRTKLPNVGRFCSRSCARRAPRRVRAPK